MNHQILMTSWLQMKKCFKKVWNLNQDYLNLIGIGHIVKISNIYPFFVQFLFLILDIFLSIRHIFVLFLQIVKNLFWFQVHLTHFSVKYLVRVIANKMYHIAMIFSHQIHWKTLRTFSSIILTNVLRENLNRLIEVNKSCIYILFADET